MKSEYLLLDSLSSLGVSKVPWKAFILLAIKTGTAKQTIAGITMCSISLAVET